MEHFAPNIAEFLPISSSLSAISSSWGRSMSENKEMIKEGTRRKYPQYLEPGAIALYAINTGNVPLLRDILLVPEWRRSIRWDILSNVVSINTDPQIISSILPLLGQDAKSQMNEVLGKDNGISPNLSDTSLERIYNFPFVFTPKQIRAAIAQIETQEIDPFYEPLLREIKDILMKKKDIHPSIGPYQLAILTGDIPYVQYLEGLPSNIHSVDKYLSNLVDKLHGDMLIYILSKKGVMNKYLHEKYKHGFNVLNTIINLMKVPNHVRNKALGIAVEKGFVYLLDGNTNKDNIVGIFASIPQRWKTDPESYKFLEQKGLRPDLFKDTLEGKDKGDLWKKVIATAAAYGNITLVNHLRNLYNKYITPEMMQKLSSMPVLWATESANL